MYMVLSKLLCLQNKGPSGVRLPLGVSNKVTEYDGFEFAGKKYSVGDSVYLPPDTHKFSVKSSKNSLPKCPQRDRSDEATYPELYRKSEYIRGSNSDVSEPFQIGNTCHFTWNNRVCVPICSGKIAKITSKSSGKQEDLRLTLEMFYR